MVSKKKPRHLYEVLGKGAAQPTSAPQQEVSPPEGARPLREEERTKLPETFLPGEIPSDKALENVIVIRKDTAVVAILLAVVMWVIAFLLGRWSVQKTSPPVNPTQKESAASLQASVEPAPIPFQPPESTESVGAASGVKEKYCLVIIAYAESQKKLADEAAEFLRSKEYPVVIEKSGDKLTIRLRGFQSKSDPQALKTLGEITSLEYKGRKAFSSAYFVEVQ
jgi:hypothetical protein